MGWYEIARERVWAMTEPSEINEFILEGVGQSREMRCERATMTFRRMKVLAEEGTNKDDLKTAFDNLFTVLLDQEPFDFETWFAKYQVV